MSVSIRSPTTSVRPSRIRSSAVSRSCGSGLPTIGAVLPVAVMTVGLVVLLQAYLIGSLYLVFVSLMNSIG